MKNNYFLTKNFTEKSGIILHFGKISLMPDLVKLPGFF